MCDFGQENGMGGGGRTSVLFDTVSPLPINFPISMPQEKPAFNFKNVLFLHFVKKTKKNPTFFIKKKKVLTCVSYSRATEQIAPYILPLSDSFPPGIFRKE